MPMGFRLLASCGSRSFTLVGVSSSTSTPVFFTNGIMFSTRFFTADGSMSLPGFLCLVTLLIQVEHHLLQPRALEDGALHSHLLDQAILRVDPLLQRRLDVDLQRVGRVPVIPDGRRDTERPVDLPYVELLRLEKAHLLQDRR